MRPTFTESMALTRGRQVLLLTAIAVTMWAQSINSAAAQDANFRTMTESNWHQWRGPFADGSTRKTSPPLEWSESKNVKWKAPIAGEGTSTPIIWEDKVFVLSAVQSQEKSLPPEQGPEQRTEPPPFEFDFVVWCLERKTGKTLWKKVAVRSAPFAGRHRTATYAGASAMTNGKHVFASFGSYGIFCFDMDGKQVWSRDLGDMRTRRGWGEAVSPVVHGKHLVVNWDQEDQSKIFVLDAATGKTTWQKNRDEPTTWATPLVVERKGVTQVVTAGTNAVRSYNIENGELIWTADGLTLNAIPCPVIWNDHVILMSGYRGNKARAIHLDSKGKVSGKPSELWTYSVDTPYVPSPTLVGDRLYFTKSLNAVLTCLDCKTGKPIFGPERLPNANQLYASPVATEKHLFISSREGLTLVLNVGDKLEVVAKNSLDDGINASPAIVGAQMFIRSNKWVYCIEQEADKSIEEK